MQQETETRLHALPLGRHAAGQMPKERRNRLIGVGKTSLPCELPVWRAVPALAACPPPARLLPGQGPVFPAFAAWTPARVKGGRSPASMNSPAALLPGTGLAPFWQRGAWAWRDIPKGLAGAPFLLAEAVQPAAAASSKFILPCNLHPSHHCFDPIYTELLQSWIAKKIPGKTSTSSNVLQTVFTSSSTLSNFFLQKSRVKYEKKSMTIRF